MFLPIMLLGIFFHPSLEFPPVPYPKQQFKLPKHPLNWICTVHVTVATFLTFTSSDVTERFLTSNHDKIIPTVSTMLNRSISIAPVISFFEPCTVRVHIDPTVNGTNRKIEFLTYIYANKYVYSGWRHSVIILVYLSCAPLYALKSFSLPHRLFYHLTDCGPQNTFPNLAFVYDPLLLSKPINDVNHNIYDRELPLAMRRSIPRPKYSWNELDPNAKPSICMATRWDDLSQMRSCTVDKFAMQHFEHFVNFTAVVSRLDEVQKYGKVITGTQYFHNKYSIFLQAIDSLNTRVLYCDRYMDSRKHRPIRLSSPFTSEAWFTIVFVHFLCRCKQLCSIWFAFRCKQIYHSQFN
jgi:hypothetical protein